MRAVDTNVIVRLIVADGAQQAKRARKAFAAGDIFVSLTVLLETEWVLRSGYGFVPPQVVIALRALAGLPGVTVEEPPVLALALQGLSEGMEFADALHLAKAKDCTAFLMLRSQTGQVGSRTVAGCRAATLNETVAGHAARAGC